VRQGRHGVEPVVGILPDARGRVGLAQETVVRGVVAVREQRDEPTARLGVAEEHPPEGVVQLRHAALGLFGEVQDLGGAGVGFVVSPEDAGECDILAVEPGLQGGEAEGEESPCRVDGHRVLQQSGARRVELDLKVELGVELGDIRQWRAVVR